MAMQRKGSTPGVTNHFYFVFIRLIKILDKCPCAFFVLIYYADGLNKGSVSISSTNFRASQCARLALVQFMPIKTLAATTQLHPRLTSFQLIRLLIKLSVLLMKNRIGSHYFFLNENTCDE